MVQSVSLMHLFHLRVSANQSGTVVEPVEYNLHYITQE